MVGRYLRGWEVVVPQGHSLSADPKSFLDGVRPQVMLKLKEEVAALQGIKFQLVLQVELQKTSQDGVVERTTPMLRHRQEAVVGTDDAEETLDRAIPNILELLEKWTQRGSGWAKTLWLDIARYQPLRGSSYISLPAEVKNKKAVVNVKNKDKNCCCKLTFQNHHKQLPTPYIIYADFVLDKKNRGARARPCKKQHPKDHSSRSVLLLIHRGAM